MLQKILIAIAVILGLILIRYLPELPEIMREAELSQPPQEFHQLKARSEGLSRNERWHEDLDFLYKYLQERHPNIYYVTPKAEFDQVVENLHAKIEQLTDIQVMLELNRIVATVQDAHTWLHLPSHLTKATTIPITLYTFADGVFVTKALAPYEHLIGTKVVSIENTPIEKIAAAFYPYIPAENDHWRRLLSPLRIVVPAFTQALGYTKFSDKAEFQFERNTGEQFSLILEAIPSGQIPASFHQSPHLIDHAEAAPMYMQNFKEDFWMEFLEASGVLYIQFNGVDDHTDSGETIGEFSQRINQLVNNNDINKVIVDLRHNGGGDNTTYPPLMNVLTNNENINKPMTLYAIIGRNTFSAAVNFAAELDVKSEVVFVGESTGNRPNMFGDCFGLELPHSGLSVCISSLFWIKSDPEDMRLTIPPDIPVQLKAADYFNHQDPVLEMILQLN